MSEQYIAAVRELYARRVLDTPEGHRYLVEANIEFVNPPDAIEPGTRRGTAELEGAGRAVAEAFDEAEHTPERYFDGGDVVVVDVLFRGRGATSGADMTQREAHTWTFSDGALVRFEWGRDLGRALAAAGLAE